MLLRNVQLPLWSLLAVALLISGCGSGAKDADTGATAPKEETAGAKDEGDGAKDEADGDESEATENENEGTEEVSNEVMLGSPELTAGIPGEGALTVEQIKAWLDNPSNHEELIPSLPLGMSLGEAGIKGIKENPLTRAKIELGRQLYFDTRLSSDSTISCASCHHPDEGYAKHTQFGVGVGGQEGGRNSPVSYNRILSTLQFWDGRAESLEAQAVGPIANPIEMANTHEVAVQTVKDIEGYELQFAAIFGDEGVTIDNIGRAIATFERAIVTGPSPYDYRVVLERYEKLLEAEPELKTDDPEEYALYEQAVRDAEAHPMSESARRGQTLFFDEKKTDCKACHAGANFTDEQYHNLGIGMAAEKPDLGRFVVTNDPKDTGAFKTPTLRNVETSAPYMHDGATKTLEEVVEIYAKGGHPNEHLSEKIKKLDLTDQDKQDLVAFMKALTGPFPKVETGRLPE